MDRENKHWATSPVSLILVIALVQLAGYMIVSALAEYFGGLLNSSDQSLLIQYAIYLVNLVISLIPVTLSLLLFFAARKGQLRWGLTGTSTWQVNWSFGAGLALTCVYLVLVWLRVGNRDFQTHSLSLMGAITLALGKLTPILFIALVYPELVQKHGTVKSALRLSAAFALVSAVIYLVVRILSSMLTPLFTANATSETIMALLAGLLPGLLSNILSTLALYLLGTGLLLVCKRSIPGAWLLLAALTGLATLCSSVLMPSAQLNDWQRLLFSNFPVNLLLYAVGLAIVFGLERYKVPGSFGQAARALLARVRGVEDDVTE